MPLKLQQYIVEAPPTQAAWWAGFRGVGSRKDGALAIPLKAKTKAAAKREIKRFLAKNPAVEFINLSNNSLEAILDLPNGN